MATLTIISGGQTGVDRTALDVAIELNIPHSGWCPPGRLAEDGIIADKYNLTETPDERSSFTPKTPRSLRTEWNVRDSDATLILSFRKYPLDAGSEWTIKATDIYHKPFLVINPGIPEESVVVIRWIKKKNIKILNIAGPSELSEPGISKSTYHFLKKILSRF